jgi:hypothetical protein
MLPLCGCAMSGAFGQIALGLTTGAEEEARSYGKGSSLPIGRTRAPFSHDFQGGEGGLVPPAAYLCAAHSVI